MAPTPSYVLTVKPRLHCNVLETARQILGTARLISRAETYIHRGARRG